MLASDVVLDANDAQHGGDCSKLAPSSASPMVRTERTRELSSSPPEPSAAGEARRVERVCSNGQPVTAGNRFSQFFLVPQQHELAPCASSEREHRTPPRAPATRGSNLAFPLVSPSVRSLERAWSTPSYA
jgi:hypothetical protein